MLYKTEKARVVSQVVPDSFRFLANDVREFINVDGCGLSYLFENNGIRNIINVMLPTYGPIDHNITNAQGQFVLLIEAEGQVIKGEKDCTVTALVAFCNAYAQALIENKKGGVGLG